MTNQMYFESILSILLILSHISLSTALPGFLSVSEN